MITLDPQPHDTIADTQLLGTLTDAQRTHLSLGLMHTFGAVLDRCDAPADELFILTMAGRNIGIHATCTVAEAWRIAEGVFTNGGEIPVKVAGVVNVLAGLNNQAQR